MIRKGKMVFGVGVNDADYPVTTYANVDGRLKMVSCCPFYKVWVSMLARCYSEKSIIEHPTYAECAVSSEWLSFSAFREWMVINHCEGKHLDKDILAIGSKVYSAKNCVFVSRALNNFMNDHGSSRGKWPIGVSLEKGRFRARCCDPFSGKQKTIGHFDTPIEAHEAWRNRKHEHACAYADMQTDPRIAQALRIRYAKPAGEKP